jgi:steroid delta-isomerase-like uncharacterized protein
VSASEEHKALIRRFYEEWYPAGDVDHIMERVSEDFLNHASPPDAPRGPENIRVMAGLLADAFSEQRYEIHHLVGEGDTVVVHATWHAIHTGPFMGIPASGRAIASDQIHVFRIAEDQVAEHWAVRDDLTMLRQMGIAPG